MKYRPCKKYRSLCVLASLSMLANPVSAALVAHYEFEETSGTTLVDSSGNGFDGTAEGSGDLNVSGAVGSAYQPGPTNADYGVFSGNVNTATEDFGITGNNARTISLWFNTSSFGNGSNDQFRLLGIGVGAAAESFDIVAENGNNANDNDGNGTIDNRIGLRYGNGNVYFNADNNGNDFDVDTWYHLALVYDGTTLDLESIGTAADGNGLLVYVNGVQVNTAGGNLNNANQALNTGNGNFAFGTRNDLSQFGDYPGLLDDVRVYDSALNASEVATLAGIPEPSAALLGALGILFVSRRRR